MSLTIEQASLPRWADAAHTGIDLTVVFAEIAGALPFTAMANDAEAHGRELHARALAGEFGEIAEYVAPAPVVPSVVTMRQARLALLGAGLLPQVDAAIAALPSPQKEAALIEWDYSSEVHRDRPFVQVLGAALALTPEQLDALFVTAGGL